jgi:hypothetical protein
MNHTSQKWSEFGGFFQLRSPLTSFLIGAAGSPDNRGRQPLAKRDVKRAHLGPHRVSASWHCIHCSVVMKTGTLKSAQILAPFEQFQGADDGLLTEFATGYLAPRPYVENRPSC